MVDNTDTDKTLALHVDMAAGLFGHAASAFSDLSALFEAISESAPRASLIRRLATLGMNICETFDSEFASYKEDLCESAWRPHSTTP
jgi:hypothetical protein